ncbi:hypothetical protein FGO68_gene6699 [Halteria grandinella]|uniref:Aquaporin n=1 Tax=Halteria grandinella TaxID=5974 RepID=A0A8J8NEZ1_HALGN|nr:hypothetical protein FGO68_gene6699 [Halteria grandinella]
MEAKYEPLVDTFTFYADKSRFHSALVLEFLGTAVVTYAYTLSFFDQQTRAMAYFIVYLVAHHISGAHFNPAISLACFVNDKLRAGASSRKEMIENKDSVKQLLITMLAQLLGSVLGILIVYVLAKDYSSSLYMLPNISMTIYHYFDVFTNTDGFQFTRIFAQEALQTFVFALVFLSIRGQAYYQKCSPILKGLALSYILYACYRFSFGAGACLNPALGLTQSIYMIAIGDSFNGTLTLNQTFWVYMTAPFVGALAAAFFNGSYHQGVTEGVEAALERHHQQKLHESRSVDKIDVEDTRSNISDDE